MAKLIKLDNQTLTELRDALRDVQAQRGDWRGTLLDVLSDVENWAESTEEPERVIFRKFPHDGEIIALFPDQYNERNGMIGSYMHNGQHSDTSPDFGDTVAADAVEAYQLHRELIGQGYTNLKVVKRFGKLGRK